MVSASVPGSAAPSSQDALTLSQPQLTAALPGYNGHSLLPLRSCMKPTACSPAWEGRRPALSGDPGSPDMTGSRATVWPPPPHCTWSPETRASHNRVSVKPVPPRCWVTATWILVAGTLTVGYRSWGTAELTPGRWAGGQRPGSPASNRLPASLHHAARLSCETEAAGAAPRGHTHAPGSLTSAADVCYLHIR